jgi:hypothetical protein
MVIDDVVRALHCTIVLLQLRPLLYSYATYFGSEEKLKISHLEILIYLAKLEYTEIYIE